MHEPNIQVNLDSEPITPTPLTTPDPYQWVGTERHWCLPKVGVQPQLQGVAVPTVTAFPKPQIKAVLENRGHRLTGDIQKNLEHKVMGCSLCTDMLEE